MFWRKKTVPIQTGTFQLAAELANKRSIGCTISVLQGESIADVNRKLDLAQEAIERQRNRCEIPELEAHREQRVKALEQARAILADLEERQKGGERLSSQELMNIKNMRVNIGKAVEEIDKGTEAIAEAKRKAGVG